MTASQGIWHPHAFWCIIFSPFTDQGWKATAQVGNVQLMLQSLEGKSILRHFPSRDTRDDEICSAKSEVGPSLIYLCRKYAFPQLSRMKPMHFKDNYMQCMHGSITEILNFWIPNIPPPPPPTPVEFLTSAIRSLRNGVQVQIFANSSR